MFAFAILVSSASLPAQGSGNTCPVSVGFWKNHPSEWPMSSLVLGDQTYSKAEAVAILNLPTTGDASVNLADQLIATTLNFGISSDPNPIFTQFNQANTLLSGYGAKLPYNVDPSTADGQAMVNTANVLDRYNNNHMTPGCTPPPTPLPIQLASFTGTTVNSTTVLLRWSTLSELNNYGFFVQRRRLEEQEFTELPNSFVPGHGTTVVPQYYSYTDETALNGGWYYRLKQIDLDGTAHLSDAIRVDVVTSVPEEVPIAFALAQNYPNPFNPTTNMRFDVPIRSVITLSVYNILGQEVATLLDGELHGPGRYEIPFNGSRLGSGVYYYRMRAASLTDGKEFVQVRQMLLLK
jgi:hypothetical protein